MKHFFNGKDKIKRYERGIFLKSGKTYFLTYKELKKVCIKEYGIFYLLLPLKVKVDLIEFQNRLFLGEFDI